MNLIIFLFRIILNKFALKRIQHVTNFICTVFIFKIHMKFYVVIKNKIPKTGENIFSNN